MSWRKEWKKVTKKTKSAVQDVFDSDHKHENRNKHCFEEFKKKEASICDKDGNEIKEFTISRQNHVLEGYSYKYCLAEARNVGYDLCPKEREKQKEMSSAVTISGSFSSELTSLKPFRSDFCGVIFDENHIKMCKDAKHVLFREEFAVCISGGEDKICVPAPFWRDSFSGNYSVLTCLEEFKKMDIVPCEERTEVAGDVT